MISILGPSGLGKYLPDNLAAVPVPTGDGATTATSEDSRCAKEEPERVPVAIVVDFKNLDVVFKKRDDEREWRDEPVP